MRRIRSKKLWEFLHQSGALASGDDRVIEAAKIAYRKQYKKDWKKNRSLPKKELRPAFTEQEYQVLAYKAKINGYTTPTSYLAEIARVLIHDKAGVIPHKDKLLEVLQCIAMSHIAVETMRYQLPLYSQLADVHNALKEAEEKLNQYLHLA